MHQNDFFCSKIPQNAHNPGYGKAEPYIIQGKWQFQLSAVYNIMLFKERNNSHRDELPLTWMSVKLKSNMVYYFLVKKAKSANNLKPTKCWQSNAFYQNII